MISQARSFEFTSYNFDVSEKKANFRYSIDLSNKDRIDFTETLFFPKDFSEENTMYPELIDSILFNLHLILGISYWKTYCPSDIRIRTKPLNQKQADFWNIVYSKGLGEFFYKNKIDYRGLIKFPYEDVPQTSRIIELLDRSLVGIGGGKDSIVAIEMLKEKKRSIMGFNLHGSKESEIVKTVAKIADIETIKVTRMIDPKLLELNALPDTYNGHIPISAIYAFTGVLTAILYNYKDIVVSNEASANVGNVEYLGEMINHQWSKSKEFELLFSEYIHTNISTSVNYYSVLRPYSELKILKEFTKYKQYFSVFSSCNRNFTLTKSVVKKWCGECPKCAFVFAGLAAFLPKEEVINIFGRNLFTDESLVILFKQLAGLELMKPFECVGTYEETKLALYLAYKRMDYKGDAVMKMFESEILPYLDTVAQMEKEIL